MVKQFLLDGQGLIDAMVAKGNNIRKEILYEFH